MAIDPNGTLLEVAESRRKRYQLENLSYHEFVIEDLLDIDTKFDIVISSEVNGSHFVTSFYFIASEYSNPTSSHRAHRRALGVYCLLRSNGQTRGRFDHDDIESDTYIAPSGNRTRRAVGRFAA